jgi:hypothetical protein
MQHLQKFGIKPDGIINFLSNEPPRKQRMSKDIAELAPRRIIKNHYKSLDKIVFLWYN